MGRTYAQRIADQRRTLAAIRNKLLDLASDWDGEDQFCLSEITGIADRIDTLSDGMKEAAQEHRELIKLNRTEAI